MKSQPFELYPQFDITCFHPFHGSGSSSPHVPTHPERTFVSTLRCSPQQMCAKSHAQPTKAGGGAFKQPPRGKWRHAEKTSRPSASTEDSCAFLCIIPLCAECIWAVKNALMNQSYCRCRVQAGCAEISQREDVKARLVWFQLHREFLLRLTIVPV